jgi:pyridoxamine 5'-phosphate oxidase
MLAPWRSPLARALHHNRSLPYARYMQLATVRPNGQPANRTVVFRGFLENSNQLMVVTDARSEKMGQIQQQSWGEVCWYFPKSREQFRLLGRLTVVMAESSELELSTARQQLWHNLSDAARVQFAWAAPGQPRAVDDSFNPPLPDPLVPLPNFWLLLFDPTQIDHLALRGNPQNRDRYSLESPENWSVTAINP